VPKAFVSLMGLDSPDREAFSGFERCCNIMFDRLCNSSPEVLDQARASENGDTSSA